MGEITTSETNQNETSVSTQVKGITLLRPIATPAELIERHKEVTILIKDSLEEGKDYGIIPGTNAKNVLLKPGAERLCVAFGCHPEYKVSSADADHDRKNDYFRRGQAEQSVGFYRYVIVCDLLRGGQVVGSGIGSCSTMENKYISRPRDVENTVLKMAQKRALVAAVLNTFALSDRFTQDIEEEVVVAPEPKATKVYTATQEQQDAVIEILKKKKVPEDKWHIISQQLMNRPGADLPKIIEGVMH